MAETALFELPTGRRSYIAPPTGGLNVHDKDWIPVLDAFDLKKVQDFQEKESAVSHGVSFSPFPKVEGHLSSSTARPPVVQNYSKPSLASEGVTSELEGDSLPPPRTSSKNAALNTEIAANSQQIRDESDKALSNDGQDTITSDGADASSAGATTSMLEEQYYTLPGVPVTNEDIKLPLSNDPVSISARSSIASARTKSSIPPPTSKYNNRKTGMSAATSNKCHRSQPPTPHESPKLLPAIPLAAPPLPQSETFPSSGGPYELSQTTPPATPKMLASKSTASERRARALHSHPSTTSLASQTQSRSRANSSSDEADAMPKPPSIRHRPRKSTDSRSAATKNALFDVQCPTPAPTTPLPQLPPEASSRRPSIARAWEGLGIKHVTALSNSQNHQSRPASPRENGFPLIQQPQQAHLPALPRTEFSSNPSAHTGMAQFMTKTSTVVFRRFDDIHVKLMLYLQEEISQLEKELIRVDNAVGAAVDMDKETAKTIIMRDLRRVVAEYDQLFANWTQMQASKASKQTLDELKAWLEKPQTSAGESNIAVNDGLMWLENQKDLSEFKMNIENEKPGSFDVRTGDEKNVSAAAAGGGGGGGGVGGGGGGLSALFSCAGRRK